jgi:uncharacterized membrane protein
MPSYQTTIDIAAEPSLIWAVTCDIEAWPAWSPTMDEVTRQDSGPIRPGSSAVVRQPGLRKATWVVDEADADRSFIWHTSAPGCRITATHILEPKSSGTGTTVRLVADMTGPMSRPIWLFAGRTTRRYLDQEAAALKARCEK